MDHEAHLSLQLQNRSRSSHDPIMIYTNNDGPESLLLHVYQVLLKSGPREEDFWNLCFLPCMASWSCDLDHFIKTFAHSSLPKKAPQKVWL